MIHALGLLPCLLAVGQAQSKLAVPASIERNLGFVENRGQFDSPAQFVLDRKGIRTCFTGEGWVHLLPPAKQDGDCPSEVVEFNWNGDAGGRPVAGSEPTGVNLNYFVGSTERWATGVQSFSRLHVLDAFPGVDIEFYEHNGRLEYDLVADCPDSIGTVEITVSGQRSLVLLGGRAVAIELDDDILVMDLPHAWQACGDGTMREIDVRFVVLDDRRIGFEVAGADPSAPVRVDPGLDFGTYAGGSAYEIGNGIAVGLSGEIYASGSTQSSNWGPPLSGPRDAFAARFDPQGSTFNCTWVAFVGGNGDDSSALVDVASNGDPVLVGLTGSNTGFPSGVCQASNAGGLDVFVARIAANGTGMPYFTYLGGSNDDSPYDVTMDPSDRLWIVGSTQSTDFPVTTGALQPSNAGGITDGYLACLDLATLNAGCLVYGSYFGGSGSDLLDGAAAVIDAASSRLKVYVCGNTDSLNLFTTPQAFQATKSGGLDAFVARIDPGWVGSQAVEYSSYLGGSLLDSAADIAATSAGRVVVSGGTTSPFFPTTTNAYRTSPPLGQDAFVSEFDSNALGSASLVYSSLFGGTQTDICKSIALGPVGWLYLYGVSDSTDLPITPGGRPPSGMNDLFVAVVDLAAPATSFVQGCTYIGGSDDDDANADVVRIAIDQSGRAYVIGTTSSPGTSTAAVNFPTTATACQTTSAGSRDACIAVFDFGLCATVANYCTAGFTSNGCTAMIHASGAPSASASSGFTITVTGAEPQKQSILFYGINNAGFVPVPWGTGTSWLCVKPPQQRMGLLNTGGTLGSCNGMFAMDWLAFVATTPSALGVPFTAGQQVYAQAWFRDPPSPKTTSLSNALTFALCP